MLAECKCAEHEKWVKAMTSLSKSNTAHGGRRAYLVLHMRTLPSVSKYLVTHFGSALPSRDSLVCEYGPVNQTISGRVLAPLFLNSRQPVPNDLVA